MKAIAMPAAAVALMLISAPRRAGLGAEGGQSATI